MKQYRKRTYILRLKTRCFPKRLKIFLTNPNDNLKNMCHSKIVLGRATFQLLSESADLVTFTEEILNGKLHFLCRVSWQWLLFHLINRELWASHKTLVTLDYYFKKIYKMMLLSNAYEVALSEGNFSFSSLQSFARVSTAMFAGWAASRTCSTPII